MGFPVGAQTPTGGALGIRAGTALVYFAGISGAREVRWAVGEALHRGKGLCRMAGSASVSNFRFAKDDRFLHSNYKWTDKRRLILNFG